MTSNNPRRRPPKKRFALNNQMLGLLAIVLTVALIVLLAVSCSINTDNHQTGSQDGTVASSQPTDPSNETDPSQTSEPTEPTETSTPTEPSEPTGPTGPSLPTTPSGGKYVDVGYGNIAEIIQLNAETFLGEATDDYSRPTNNYLPQGTVDYYKIIHVNDDLSYVLLRSGQRVYFKRKIYPPVSWPEVTKRYEGELPDHNEINVASLAVVDNQTVLTLDCLWKAPFYLDLAPQQYANPDAGSGRDYAVASVTVTHVDITFCYATAFEGEINIGSNPLFKSAEIIKNESDYTLRLHLRKTGGFYGWTSYYNDNGQLCFQFLNPPKATASTGAYGADLTGIKIFIDVGHGGIDGGAAITDASGQKWEEEDLNLNLALKLRDELLKTGATVIINRVDDTNMNTDERVAGLVEASPDICLSVHQNMYGSDSSVSGHWNMYFTPFSQPLSKKIIARIDESDIYKKTTTKWNPFYMTRQSVCPVVCLENGFMTNAYDLSNMLDDAVVARKAQVIAQGVADYFLSINS